MASMIETAVWEVAVGTLFIYSIMMAQQPGMDILKTTQLLPGMLEKVSTKVNILALLAARDHLQVLIYTLNYTTRRII